MMSKTPNKSKSSMNMPDEAKSIEKDSVSNRKLRINSGRKKSGSNSKTISPPKASTNLVQKFLLEVSEENHEDLEYKEKEELNKFAVLLRSRKDILCYKFINNIRAQLDRKKGIIEDGLTKKRYLTEMISVSDTLVKVEQQKIPAKANVIDDLDKYIESLNLDQEDLDNIGVASSSTMDIALGTHWKEVNDVEVHDASAWGRRIFDDEEIDAEEESELFKTFAAFAETEAGKKYISCTDRNELQKHGLWDMVYNSDIMPDMQKNKKLKPWLTNKIDLENEMKQLGIKKKDLRLDDTDQPVVLDVVNNPIDRLTAKYLGTGSYLRPHDMLFCIERTKFTEEKIVAWFKRFRTECPDGKLTRHHMRDLFQKVFPDGNASKITSHVFRIFDSDGNDFLDFKEFLMAIDIANRDTDEEKLMWAFRLYDMDNNGVIDIDEMANIIDTLDCIEGVKPGVMRYDENGHPVAVSGAEQRAEELFSAIDRDNDGSLTLEEFLESFTRMAEILKRQDAIEQRKKLYCLIIYGPKIQRNNNFSEDRMIDLCKKVLTSNVGVNVEKEDIAHVELRSVSSAESVFTKSIFIKFHELDLRNKIWENKGHAERSKVFMEEWLTDFRTKLMRKCKKLLAEGFIENVKTKNGDIIVLYKDKVDGKLTKKVVIYQEDFDLLLVLIGKEKEEKLDISKLDASDAAILQEEALTQQKEKDTD